MGQSFLPAVAALRAAAEPTRLRLLALLSRGELTVGEICDIFGQSQPRISRHLKVLSDTGLLDRFREQNWVYYRTPTSGQGRENVVRLLELVSTSDDVLQRDRRRLEGVVAERRKMAATVSSPATLPSEVDRVLVNELASEPIGALLDVGTGAGHL